MLCALRRETQGSETRKLGNPRTQWEASLVHFVCNHLRVT